MEFYPGYDPVFLTTAIPAARFYLNAVWGYSRDLSTHLSLSICLVIPQSRFQHGQTCGRPLQCIQSAALVPPPALR